MTLLDMIHFSSKITVFRTSNIHPHHKQTKLASPQQRITHTTNEKLHTYSHLDKLNDNIVCEFLALLLHPPVLPFIVVIIPISHPLYNNK